MKKKLTFLNHVIDTLASVVIFAVVSSCISIPAAALSIFIHLSVYTASVVYNIYFYPVFIILLIILSVYLYKKKAMERISLFIGSFLFLPVFILAGYPLFKIIEAAAHICGGENYLLGVLFYTVLPVSAGYFTFAGTYIIYMYHKKFKEKIMHAFVYFLFASAFGLVLLIKAYNCGDL